MTPVSIRKQAVWLYGILIGLALKEAFSLVIPHFINTPESLHSRSEHFTEMWRLGIFAILAIRFYFGAVVYFDKAYETSEPVEGAAKYFAIDFLFGFVHFILFLALAYSVPTHSDKYEAQDKVREGIFLGLVMAILLYDILWFWMTASEHPARSILKRWTKFNCVTAATMVAVYIAIYIWYSATHTTFDYGFCESVVLVPVIIASVIDVLDLVVAKSFVRQLMDNIGNWFKD